MSFKGEIALGALNSKYKYGFTVGDIYRVQGAGNLVPNNLAVANGAFVEWTSNGWEIKKDMQYAVSKTGASLDDAVVSLEEVFFANMDIPASTLRFSFGDLNYDPTKDGRKSQFSLMTGTWKKLFTKYTNIWEYTASEFANATLSAFYNGTNGVDGGFFNNIANPVKVLNINTTGMEVLDRLFSWNVAITHIYNFSIDNELEGGVSTKLVFNHLENLIELPNSIDLSNSNNLTYTFQHCHSIERIGEIILPNDADLSLSAQGFLSYCFNLKEVSKPLNMKSVTNMQNCCSVDHVLEHIIFVNTNRVTNVSFAFAVCDSMKTPVEFEDGLGSCTSFNSMYSKYLNSTYNVAKMKVNDMPSYDMSSASNCSDMFYGCDIREIDSTKLSTLAGSVKVNGMFADNRNCKSGILDAYAVLDAIDSSHTDCFKDCGIDTEEGRAELEQIPTSWGGLAL